MTSRTLLSIVLGVACSALAVGGLYWAGGRDAAVDPLLDQSADARAAYAAGQEPADEPRLRPPAPTGDVEVVEAAGADRAAAADPQYADEHGDDDDREYGDDGEGHEDDDDDDEGEDD
ncbi:MAG: hypothetical protein RL190_159, partial [Actinomycetota bacterium]